MGPKMGMEQSMLELCQRTPQQGVVAVAASIAESIGLMRPVDLSWLELCQCCLAKLLREYVSLAFDTLCRVAVTGPITTLTWLFYVYLFIVEVHLFWCIAQAPYRTALELLALEAAAQQSPDNGRQARSDLVTSEEVMRTPDAERKQLEDKVQELQDEKQCVICKDVERNICIVGCGHTVVCKHCADQIEKCPMCNRRIEGR